MTGTGSRVLTAADFPFLDADGDNLAAIKITSLPSAGTLTVDGNTVGAGTTIALYDIAGQRFVFTPDANGPQQVSFEFQVQDDGSTATGGANLDPSPNTLTIIKYVPPVTVALTPSSGTTAAFELIGALVDAGISTAVSGTSLLLSASVSIAAGFQAGQDVLAFNNDGANMGDLTAAYDASKGVLRGCRSRCAHV